MKTFSLFVQTVNNKCLSYWWLYGLLLFISGSLKTQAQDIVLTGFQTGANDQLSFVATTDIPPGTTIYFRDDEWNGTGFVDTNEGTLSYTTPATGLAAGTVVVLTVGTATASDGGAVTMADATLDLSTNGDFVYAYYGTAWNAPTEILSVLANTISLSAAEDPTGDPLAPNVAVISLPSTLINFDNVQYNGPRTNATLTDFVNIANWTGANTPITLNTTAFTFPCATISNLTTSVTASCSGDAIQVCVTADLSNNLAANVLFADNGGAPIAGTATSTTLRPKVHVATLNAFAPYTMPAGPIYVGDIIYLPANSTHPVETTSVPAGASPVASSSTSVYYVITTAGTYDIRCTFHSTMTGSFVALARPNTTVNFCASFSPTNTSACAADNHTYTATVEDCTPTLTSAPVGIYPDLVLTALGDGTCGVITATPTPSSCTNLTYSTTFTSGGTNGTATGASFTPSAGQAGSVAFTLTNSGAPVACATVTSSAASFNCAAAPVCPTSVNISGAPATACQGATIMMTAVVDQGVLGTDYTIQWQESIAGSAFASVGAANGGQTLMYMPVVTWAAGCGGEAHTYQAIVTQIGACTGTSLTSNSNNTNVYPNLSITASGNGTCGVITATPTPATCGTTTYSVSYTTGTGTTSGTGTTFTPPTGTVGTVTFTLTNNGAPAACTSAVSTAVAFNCPAVDPCAGFAAPTVTSPINVCEGGSTTITPSGGGLPGGITDLFISEYIEGSSNNKCIEIYNGTGAAISLTGYAIGVYSNGSPTISSTFTLAGTIANNDVWVVCNASTTIFTAQDQSLALNYNGDDAVALLKNGTPIDIFGNIGCDPGTAWTSGALSTLDRTLVRNAPVGAGVTIDPVNGPPCDFPTLGTEWTGSAIDIASNLGSHTTTATAGTPPSYNYYTTDPAGGGQTPVATGATYTPTVAAGTSTTIYVTAISGTCESTAVPVVVSVTASPKAGLDGSATVCDATAEGTTTIDLSTLLSGADAGGTFAPVGAAPALTGTTFDGNGLATGTYSYTYTVAPTAPCATSDVATFVITVNDCVGAVCSISIGTITVSACTYSGGQSTASVGVPITWANAPTGENIVVNVQGATAQTITAPAVSGNQTLNFTVPANGTSGQTITAAFSTTGTCSDNDVYTAPTACAPNCTGFVAPTVATTIAVCEGGSTTITPTGGGDGATAPATIADLFISEYIEGSSNNKCIEIFNGTTAAITLTGVYSIAVYSNGAVTPNTPIALTGTIAAGDVFVICQTTAAANFLTLSDQTASLNYNGDDVVELRKNGVAIDIFGNIGCDPGTNWASGALATSEQTLVRNAAVYVGITTDPANPPCDFPTLASEWTSFAQDNIANLGVHTSVPPIVSTTYYNYYTADPTGGGQTPVATGTSYTPTVAPGGSTTIYVTAANGTCESTPVAVAVSVRALPRAGLDASASVCNATTEGTTTIDLSTLLSGADAGGTFAPVGAAPALTGTTFDGNGLTPGIHTYTYTVLAVAPCTGSDVASISINVQDCVIDCSTFAAPTVVSPINVCQGGSTTITPSGGGAGGSSTPQSFELVWNFENQADFSGVSSNTAVVAPPPAPMWGSGITTVPQVVGSGCSNAISSSGYNTTTPDQASALAQNDYLEFCAGTLQAGYTLNISSIEWTNRSSGTGPANYAVFAASNLTTPLATGVITAAGLNVCEDEVALFTSTDACFRFYYWGATNSTGTLRIDSLVMKGQSIPIGGISYNFYSANPVPGPATLLSGAAYSYTPTVPVGGTTTVYVTAQNGTCESTAVPVVISVTAAANAGADGTATACNNNAEGTSTVDLATLLNGADAGGSFAPVGSAPALTGTTFDGNGLIVGTYQYTYTVLPTSPCTASDVANFSIQVNDCVTDPCTGFIPPVVPTVKACEGDPVSFTPTSGGIIPITDLFISEYVEGTGNNKCIEIFNGTGAPVVLDGVYQLKLHANGSVAGGTPINLTGTIANGDVFVICNSGASAALLALDDQSSGSISFNGNDAVVLLKNSIAIDIVGNIGCDPIAAWIAGGSSTLDQTLVRVPSVTTGIATDPANTPCDFPTLATEWTSQGLDNFSNLGSHTSMGGTVALPPTSYNVYANNGGVPGALLTSLTPSASYSAGVLPIGTTTYFVTAASSSPACESAPLQVVATVYPDITATVSAGNCTNNAASISQDNAAFTATYTVAYTTGTGNVAGTGFVFDYSAISPGVEGTVTFTVTNSGAPAPCNTATFDVPFSCIVLPCSILANANPSACSGTSYDLSVAVAGLNTEYTQFIVNVAGTQYGPYNYADSPVTIPGLPGNGATSVPVTVTDYGGWVINEILYDPATDANGDGTISPSGDDFVEIVNLTGTSQDIGGYTLQAGATTYTFPTNTIIPNKCSVLVFGGGTPTGTFGGATVLTGGFSLPISTGTITFANTNGTLATHTYTGSVSDNASIVRNPDLTGGFVLHTTVVAAAFSPGTQSDGTQFVGCAASIAACAVSTSYDAPTCQVLCPALADDQDVAVTAICSGETVSYTTGGIVLPSPGIIGTPTLLGGPYVTWVYSTVAGFDAYGASAIPFNGTLPANIGCTPVTYYIKARLDGTGIACQDVSAEFAVTVYPQISYTITAQGACTATIVPACPGFMVHYTPPGGSMAMGTTYTAPAGTSGTVSFIIMQDGAPIALACDEVTVNVPVNCPGATCSVLNDLQNVSTTAICSGSPVSYTVGGVTNNSFTGGTVTWVYGTTAGFNAYTGVSAPFSGTLPANATCAAITYYIKARLDGVTGCQDVSAEFAVTVYPNITSTIVAQSTCTVSVSANCPSFTISYADPVSGANMVGSSYTAATGTSGNVVFTITQTAAPLGFACRTANVQVPYNCPFSTCSVLNDLQNVSTTAICSGSPINYVVGGVTNNSFTGGTVTWVYSTTAGFNAYTGASTPFSGTLPANTTCNPTTYYIKARLDGVAGCQDVSAEFAVTVYPQISYTITSQNTCTASIAPSCPGFLVTYTNPTTGSTVSSNTYTAPACTQGNLTFTITQTGAPVDCNTASAIVPYNCILSGCGGCTLPTVSTPVSQGSNGGISPFYYTTYTYTVSGGTPPYNFVWNNSGYVRYDIYYNANGSVTITIYASDSGIYNLTVTDSAGCQTIVNDDNTTITAPSTLDITSHIISPSTSAAGNGGVNITVGGGVPGYTYIWSNGATTQDISGVPFGWYSVTVTDSSNPQQTTIGWYWVPRSRRGRNKTDELTLLTATPNPFKESTQVHFVVSMSDQVRVSAYNAAGIKVADLYNGYVEADEAYEVPFDASRLPAGIYFLELAGEKGERQIVKVAVE